MSDESLPTNHPSRCGRGRCTKPALPGTPFCMEHRTNIYSKSLGPRLGDFLTGLATMSPDERHSLEDELDCSRAIAQRAAQLFGASDASEDPATKVMAGQAFKGALGFVADMAVKATKVRESSLAVVDVEILEYILQSIVVIVEEECYDSPAVAEAICKRLDEIRLPGRRSSKDDAKFAAEDLLQALDEMDEVTDGTESRTAYMGRFDGGAGAPQLGPGPSEDGTG